MLLTAGTNDVQRLMAGDASANKFAKIGVGTGSIPVSQADAALTNAVIKNIETIDYFTDGHVQFNMTLSAADPAMIINEVGIYDANNVLLYRKVITQVNKVAGATYAIQYKIKVQ